MREQELSVQTNSSTIMKTIHFLRTYKCSLFLLLALLPLLLQAQSSFTKGFVVTTEGDTLKGFINDKDWDFHPNTIQFKNTENDKAVEYTAKELKGIQTESGKHFEVFTVEINKTPDKEVSFNSKANMVERTIFTQPIIKGVLSLYFYQSPDFEKHYLVQKGTEDLMELLEIEYKKKQSGEVLVVTEKRYIKQLKRLTYDCKALEDRLKKLKLNIESITDYVREYNTCRSALEKDFTSMYKKSGVKWEVNLFGGMSSNSIAFTAQGNLNNFMERMDFPRGNSVAFGGGVNMILNKWNERWSAGLEWMTFKQEMSQELTLRNTGTDIQYNTHFESNINSFNFLIRYYLSQRSLRPFVKFGLGKSRSKNTEKNIVTGKSIYLTKEYKDIEEIDQSSNRMILGTGLNFSKFYLEARYSFGKGLEPIPQLRLKANELYILLGVLL